MHSTGLIAAGSLLIALVFAGCGGGDEQMDQRQQFVADAGRICERLGTDSDDLADRAFGGKPGQPISKARLKSFDRQATNLQRSALADLRELTPPEGDESQVDRIWDALAVAIDELDALAFDDPGDPNGPAATALNEFGTLASDYGLDACADGL